MRRARPSSPRALVRTLEQLVAIGRDRPSDVRSTPVDERAVLAHIATPLHLFEVSRDATEVRCARMETRDVAARSRASQASERPKKTYLLLRRGVSVRARRAVSRAKSRDCIGSAASNVRGGPVGCGGESGLRTFQPRNHPGGRGDSSNARLVNDAAESFCCRSKIASAHRIECSQIGCRVLRAQRGGRPCARMPPDPRAVARPGRRSCAPRPAGIVVPARRLARRAEPCPPAARPCSAGRGVLAQLSLRGVHLFVTW